MENALIPVAAMWVLRHNLQYYELDIGGVKPVIEAKVAAKHFGILGIIYVIINSLFELAKCFAHVEGSTSKKHQVDNALCLAVSVESWAKHLSIS